MNLQNSPDYYILIDENMFIVSYSKNVSDIWESLFLTKLRKKENLRFYIPEILLSSFMKGLKYCLQSKYLIFEQAVKFPNGETHNLYVNLNPVILDNNARYAFICIQNNADKRLLLAKQRETLANYAHLTSHKLRAPLSNILSLSNSIRDSKIYDPEIIRNLLADITKQAESLDAIIYTLNGLISTENEEIVIKPKLSIKEIKNIVLIDDEPVVNKIHEKILSTYFPDVSIKIYTDGAEALHYLTKSHTDLIILDINMPGVDGWQFLDELNKRHIRANIIILSSSIDPAEKNRAFRYENVKHFWNKPLTVEQISFVLESMD